MPKKWIGSKVDKCDVCNAKITNWWVDGRTIQGYWANMCPVCFETIGVGLGIGLGQKYDHATYNKIEG